MFHPSEAGRDVDMQKEGRRGQAKRSFVSDVVSFLSRIFRNWLLSELEIVSVGNCQNWILSELATIPFWALWKGDLMLQSELDLKYHQKL